MKYYTMKETRDFPMAASTALRYLVFKALAP